MRAFAVRIQNQWLLYKNTRRWPWWDWLYMCALWHHLGQIRCAGGGGRGISRPRFDSKFYVCKITGWVANRVDPDQTPRSAASDQGLHCLLRPVCPNMKNMYDNLIRSNPLENILDPPVHHCPYPTCLTTPGYFPTSHCLSGARF